MDKLPLDICLSQEDVNKRLDSLEVLIEHYSIALLDVTLQITYELSELGIGEVVPIEIVERINQVHDQVFDDLSKQYLQVKNDCNRLQDEILTLYTRLQPNLPVSFIPPYIFDVDLVIDIFYHQEYLIDYAKELQIYEVLIDLRKQHAAPAAPQTTKANVVTLVPKDLH